MEGLGIGSDILDHHYADPKDFDGSEYSVEYFRISQALLQAGLDIHMLSPLDRGRIAAALWTDNTLFEEGGALLKIFYQSYGALDAMHISEEEKEKIEHNLHEAEAGLGRLKMQWEQLPEDEREKIQRDWNARSKNMAAFYYEVEDISVGYPPSPSLFASIAAFTAANSMEMGGAQPTYHLARQHLIDESRLERVTKHELKDATADILKNMNITMESLDIREEIGDRIKPEGFWVEKIEAERANHKETPNQHIEELGAADTWVGKEDMRKAIAEQALEEANLN